MKHFQQIALSVVLAFTILILGSIAEPSLASAHVSSGATSQSPAACSSWQTMSDKLTNTFKGYAVDVSLQQSNNANGAYCGQVRAVVCFVTPSNNSFSDVVLWQEFYENNQYVGTQRFYFFVPLGSSTSGWCSTGQPYSVSTGTMVTEIAQLQGNSDGSAYFGAATDSNRF